MFTEKIAVIASPPFNFDLSARIFASGDKQIRIYEEGVFRQVIRIGEKLALACVESVGTTDKSRLIVELKTNHNLTEEAKKKAAETIKFVFNLRFDLAEFYENTRKDKTMSLLVKKLCGLKSPTTQFAFERKIVKKWGDALSLEDEMYYAYPTPRSLSWATQQ
jgi:DNA-3-methyladenine glycosylase II